ncbi:hypothetical protein Tco_1180950 [Tanacetum coccineum]
MPLEGTYSVEDVAILNARQTPIPKQPETLLCLVGLSRRYFLGDDMYPIFLHDDGREMDLFNLISALNPVVIKTDTRPRTAHEVPLLMVIASQQIDMDEPAATSESSGSPSTIERSPLDFSNENPSEQINEGDGAEDQGPKTMASVVPPAEPSSTMGAAPNIVKEEETAVDAPLVSKRRLKRANEESNANAPWKVLRKDFDASHPTQSTVRGKSLTSIRLGASSTVSAPASQETPASTMNPVPISFAKPSSVPKQDIAQFLGQFNMTLARQVAMGSQLRLQFEQEAKLLRKYVAQIACRDQRIQAMEGEKKNLETLLEAEADMRKAAEAKNAESVKEMESLRTQCQLFRLMLDALSIDFDEELYPHMLTAIAGRRQTFANMVSSGITKGFYDGLKHGVEQGEAKLDLAMVEGYDPEAEGQFIATMQALKDLYSLQLKIPVYPEVRDPQDPWAVKEAMLLEDAIAENVSRAEKKKKCRIVCRTHGVGSAHHARSDDIPVSVPTAVLQGLAILLADATTQTDVLEEESSPKLTRSKLLPLM